MGKRLFIGGLPFSIGDQQLNEVFSQVGAVESATVIMDKFSGRSKGFGFVEMSTEEEAQKAIQTLNNTELEGRRIVVNEARPLEARPQRDFGNRGGGYGDRNRNDHRGNRNSRSQRW